jgi:capsular polysaccharide biosynthesis protein
VTAAAKTCRRLKGENQLPKVVQGVTFTNGVEVTKTPTQNATRSRRHPNSTIALMPLYVANVLGVATGGNDQLKRERDLPIRLIARPCLVAVGHGIRVYGHFMIEMLFRILVARKAFGGMKLRSSVLLDKQAPGWLLDILTNDLGISPDDLEFFDSSQEQVRLKHAILPGSVFIGERVHPIANELLAEFLQNFAIPASGRRRVHRVPRREALL